MCGKRFAGLLGCLLVLTTLSGCGGSDAPDLAENVTGRVTLNGQAVQDAIVTFEPQGGRPSSGVTDAEGRFVLYYSESHQGALPGEHLVRISKMSGEAGDELIPAQHNINSTRTVTVSKEGPNDFTFEL